MYSKFKELIIFLNLFICSNVKFLVSIVFPSESDRCEKIPTRLRLFFLQNSITFSASSTSKPNLVIPVSNFK